MYNFPQQISAFKKESSYSAEGVELVSLPKNYPDKDMLQVCIIATNCQQSSINDGF